MPSSRFLEYHTQKALAYGERVFKTDLRFLLKGGFWSTVGQTASTLSALALSIALSRWVPKEIYGEYKYTLAFVAVLGSLCLNGMSTAVFQSTARGFGHTLPEGLRASLKWSFLVFIGALGIGGYYLFHGNVDLGIGILVGGSLAPFLTSANLYNPFLAGKKDFRLQSLYGIIGTIIPALTILITAFFHPTALALILAYFIANTLVTVFLYVLTLRTDRARETARDPEMITYAWHQSAMGLLSTFAGNIDQLFLFHYIGAIEVAIYTFAIGILDQAKGPLKTLDSMIQSRFANQETQSIKESMNNKMLWLFVFSIIMVAGFIVTVPYLYEILFPAYISAVPYAQLYAFSMLGMCVAPANSYLSAKKKVKEQYVSTIINSGLQIGAIFIGIVSFGLWGLIWARVTIRLGGSMVTYLLYRSAIKHEPAS